MGSGSLNLKLLKELDLLTLQVLTSNNKQIAHEYNQSPTNRTIQQTNTIHTVELVR